MKSKSSYVFKNYIILNMMKFVYASIGHNEIICILQGLQYIVSFAAPVYDLKGYYVSGTTELFKLYIKEVPFSDSRKLSVFKIFDALNFYKPL